MAQKWYTEEEKLLEDTFSMVKYLSRVDVQNANSKISLCSCFFVCCFHIHAGLYIAEKNV